MRYLGIDFGEKRIGIAVCDDTDRICLPLTTLSRTSDRSAIRDILHIAQEQEVVGFVVGDPVLLDGSSGPAAERVRSFAAKLESRGGLPVHMVGETLTSREAEHRLRAGGVRGKLRRESIDAVAAQILLQDWLDGGRR